MGWVVFRIEDFDTAMLYYQRLFAFDFKTWILPGNYQFFFILVLGFFFSFVTMAKWGLKLQDLVFYTDYSIRGEIIMMVICGALLALSVASITTTGFNPFIYFRF